MARVVGSGHRAAIDPLKHSQPLGGALVFLGLARTMPMLHGSQGCSSFAKALLTRHFNEPIPLQTTAITEVTAVLGAGDLLTGGLDTIAAKQRPDVIGVLTTGLTEVSGEDVAGELRTYVDGLDAADAPLVVGVSTPDFCGGLSDGYAAALDALMRAVPFDRPGAEDEGEPAPGGRLALLTGPSLSAVDLDELAGYVEGFGLDPLIVPDLSGSLDGHLDDGWSPLTTGGTTMADLRSLHTVDGIAVLGATAAQAGETLSARTGAANLISRDHLCGLDAVDAFITTLMELTDRPVPRQVRRWRSRLADGLLDSHFVLGGTRVALAMEPEQLVGVGSLLCDVGAEIVAAVSPTDAPVLARAPWDEVVVGDFTDLEERAAAGGAELIVASSHGRPVADRIGAAHLPVGFPVYDRLAPQLRGTAGYRGSLELLIDAANVLLDHRERTAHPAGPAHSAGTGPAEGRSGPAAGTDGAASPETGGAAGRDGGAPGRENGPWYLDNDAAEHQDHGGQQNNAVPSRNNGAGHHNTRTARQDDGAVRKNPGEGSEGPEGPEGSEPERFAEEIFQESTC